MKLESHVLWLGWQHLLTLYGSFYWIIWIGKYDYDKSLAFPYDFNIFLYFNQPYLFLSYFFPSPNSCLLFAIHPALGNNSSTNKYIKIFVRIQSCSSFTCDFTYVWSVVNFKKYFPREILTPQVAYIWQLLWGNAN